jgi:hypothetical protein
MKYQCSEDNNSKIPYPDPHREKLDKRDTLLSLDDQDRSYGEREEQEG